ncbi:MAG TPA: terpene synthase family protein [Rugosimonospora sp.]
MVEPDLGPAAPPALQLGRIGATAGRGQRDLQECAAAYPDLFPARPFEPAVFSTIALANASSAPWLDASRLRVTNRAALWAFGVDRLIDHVATSRAEVDDIVERCRAVAAGGQPAPDDALAGMLADLRDRLIAAPAHPELLAIWRDELERMLTAMVREWDWKSAGTGLPTFDEYLANADNLGFSFVYAAYWATNAPPGRPAHVEALRGAAGVVQNAIRLINDLGSYDRDVRWGDLNVLMLGVDADSVGRRIAEFADECDARLRDLPSDHAGLAGYLARQVRFNMGFYPVSDYWV